MAGNLDRLTLGPVLWTTARKQEGSILYLSSEPEAQTLVGLQCCGCLSLWDSVCVCVCAHDVVNVYTISGQSVCMWVSVGRSNIKSICGGISIVLGGCKSQ